MAELAPAHVRPRKRRPIAPGLLKRTEAAAYMGLGASTLDRLNAAGLVPAPVKLGGALFWSRAELAEWCRRGCPDRAAWSATWKALLAAGTARRGR